MKAWVICIGEPLPTDQGHPRLHRAGMLCDTLANAGHQVTWWTHSFNHFTKSHRFQSDTDLKIRDHFQIKVLHSHGYSRNVSLQRILDHKRLALSFKELSRREEKPDVIYSSFPTIELSLEASRYAEENGIPCVIDIRDLWPDVFFGLLPKKIQALGRLATASLIQQTKEALRNATSLVGVSPAYLQWGLNYAGRSATENDRVIPLSYQRPPSITDEFLLSKRSIRSKDKIVFWFLGTFGKTYDLITVIQAAKILAEKSDRFHFVISGSGDQQKELEKQSLSLKNIEFTGWLNGDPLHQRMLEADYGLAAYTQNAPQGWPNKLMEYLALGLPVLSSLKGEADELIRQHQVGFYYEAKNPRSLASLIEKISKDPEAYDKIPPKALALFHQKFDANKNYHQFAEYLEQISQAQQMGKAQCPSLM